MNYLKVLPLTIFPFFSAGVVLGGAANADFECKAKSGDITLTGDIPGDFAEFNLVLRDGKAEEKFSDQKEKIYVIEDFSRGVFSFVVDRKEETPVQIYAIPDTIKAKQIPNGMNATFDAVLQLAPIPGYSGPISYNATLHDVEMGCKYHYSI